MLEIKTDLKEPIMGIIYDCFENSGSHTAKITFMDSGDNTLAESMLQNIASTDYTEDEKKIIFGNFTMNVTQSGTVSRFSIVNHTDEFVIKGSAGEVGSDIVFSSASWFSGQSASINNLTLLL